MTIDNMSVKSLHKALNDGGYICSPSFSASLMTAIKTKPLGGAFLYGMAGTGKSFLPHALSNVLNRPLFSYQCTQSLQPEDLLVKPMPDDNSKSGIKVMPSILLEASTRSHDEEVIVMLDEWDKTRPGADGFLLDFFQYGRLSIPGMNVDANLDNMLIFITANDDRPFHEALLRRFPKMDVKPMNPDNVLKALSLTHSNHPYMAQMIDLYCRSIVGELPKPATIQELRQLMDAINVLGDGADWDTLVYTYVTKTPETHEMLLRTRKVDRNNYNDAIFDNKAVIDAQDYGVDMQSDGNVEEVTPTMPSLSFECKLEVAEEIEIDNMDEVFGVFERNDNITSNLLAMHLDDEDPEDSIMLDWGTITKDVVYIKEPFESVSVAWAQSYLLKNNRRKDGELKFIDRYITRKELSRMIAGKNWQIHKRDKSEIIARKFFNNGKVDLRYTEEEGLEIIASATLTNLVDIFKFNASESLIKNQPYYDIINNYNDKIININDLYEQSNLVAGQMIKVVENRKYTHFGSTQIKRLSEHKSFCRMTKLRAPTGGSTSTDEQIDFDEMSKLMTAEIFPYGERSMHLKAKNLEIALSDECGENGTLWVKIDGALKGNLIVELLNWTQSIPIYRCFKFQGNLFNKLLKRGWSIHQKNAHCLHKDSVYARFVYDYVVFTTFLNYDGVFDESSLELLFKTKLNRIKQLEKRYNQNK